MGQITTHSEAQREFDEAIAYYESARHGLGREFRDEVMAIVSRIVENPKRYSIRKFEVRRANLNRFPYHVNYLLEGATVVIVAIAHDRRSPFYWRRRLEKEK
jgi:plasmid stabilization system protein ParE